MRWVRYTARNAACFGILEGETIIPVVGDPFSGYEKTSDKLAFAEARLLPPVIPPTFYAAGVNYATHLEHSKSLGNTTNIPKKPDIGYRAVNALIGPDDPIVIPRASVGGRVQYEGELVVVIGRKAKHLSEAEALSCVLGYTIGNDVSERAWQREDRTLWRAKNTDTFKPMGPWIETEADLAAMETIVRLNGVEGTRFRTNDMIFGVARYISAMTQLITLYPGDMIWMGTDEPTLDMKPGDVVEVEISGIGTLRNPVVAE
jgi:2-keto-4-pentenoate hydratase/2-oxohepta-3-ene-1,7-dioic acid hydratase in catechol pathway